MNRRSFLASLPFLASIKSVARPVPRPIFYGRIVLPSGVTIDHARNATADEVIRRMSELYAPLMTNSNRGNTLPTLKEIPNGPK